MYTDDEEKIFETLNKILIRLCQEKTGKKLEELPVSKSTKRYIKNGFKNCYLHNIWEIAEAIGMKCQEIMVIFEKEMEK